MMKVFCNAKWQFSGSDLEGKPWVIDQGGMFSVAGPSYVFTADIDRNGIGDIVIWSPIAGNGMAPEGFIEIITFEESGRLSYFYDYNFYRANASGVEDLLDINQDGYAELLSMHFSDGYWISDLYQVKNTRWQKITGKFGRLTYPALTRFTYRSNRAIVTKIISGCNPDLEKDLSNTQPLNDAQYVLADSSGKRFRDIRSNALVETVATPRIIVDDHDGGRNIVIETPELIEQIFQQRRIVILYGIDHSFSHRANPHTLWVFPQRLSGNEMQD